MIGAGAGAVVGSLPSPGPQTPGAIAVGAGIGAGVGAVGLGLAGAVAGGVGGAVIGGLIAHTLGAGDPGATPRQPALPGQPDQPPTPRPQPRPAPAPQPNPGGNQFELHLPAQQAAKAGLPEVHYQVNMRGDVNASANVGGRPVTAAWSAQQAQAPYKALGGAAQQVQKTAHDITRKATTELQKIVPGAQIRWPQESAPTPKRARR
ncbi:hypothetical protein [Gordonia sp. SID5947]|uniref:hypothetical protein n=1 Tax=Gordonia sp. SID5947 TaxID=2690315 RepID=UPI0023513D6E|nr:hypothetical protein [Gordonia sp. SID5947]